jgi:hypothetical protein
MKLTEDDQAFAAALGKKLRADETEVPAEVAQRLQAARRAAVAEMEPRATQRHWFAPFWMVPAGGLVAAMAVVLLWPQGPASLPDIDEDEFAAAIEMDMLDEIELVAWMLEEESNAG